jgi:hypothetical protein
VAEKDNLMDESFDVEIVLREVLEVLRRHNLPIETASLNVSMLDTVFEEHVPQLKTYKGGILHRPIIIDNTPMLFEAQRRYPFEEIMELSEIKIRSSVEAFAEALRQDYPDLEIRFTRQLPYHQYPKYYLLAVHCLYATTDSDYDELGLKIELQQDEATQYPSLTGEVGWVITDDESYSRTEVIDELKTNYMIYTPHQIDALQAALPRFYESFRKELSRKQSGELENGH